jgi:hypothetical protein
VNEDKNFENRKLVFLIGFVKIYTLSLNKAFCSPIKEKINANTTMMAG